MNGSEVMVLSYASWKTRFGGDPGIVGKTVRLNKFPYTVIGAAPQYFNGTERFLWPELWIPIHNELQIENDDWLERRGDSNGWAVGRLKPGLTPKQASADLDTIAAQLAKEFPQQDKGIALKLTKPGFLGDGLGKPLRAFLAGIMSLAALVLLAACANLGGLFSARTADRSKELGIRIAIGSSRGRILRQLLTESMLISALGGGAAAVAARLLLHALSQFHPQMEIPVQFLVEPSLLVYVFAAAIAVLTGIIFGVIPAHQVWITDPNQTMKAAGSSIVNPRRFALREILLVVQIALCCLLVTASFVSIRGLRRTFAMSLGINPGGAVLASLDTSLGGYKGVESSRVQKRLLDAVASIPGVRAAAYSNTTPLSVNQSDTAIFPPGTTDFSSVNIRFAANYYRISPTYFAAAGTHLLYGRAFTVHDDQHAPKVAIVNQTFARQLFGVENAVGRRYPTDPGKETEVVGVVEDGKYSTLTEDPAPVVYLPIDQSPDNDTVLIVRSERPTADIVAAVRQAISSVDRGLPTFALGPWPDALAFATFPARAATIALGVLGILATMLAVTGIFGLASYTVSKRMRELGIRVALGAQQRQVLRAALQRTAILLSIGSISGLGLGVAASRLLASVVYQANASDPFVIVGVAVTMAFIGLISAAVPARRALQVEPARLLRDE
ncbi:FtsX-like permease family protein [Acidisarcina polymorpha]|uniref:FtsX-like permease family protein n=1 Tax=Acidisarcina polymorpha TaxID=2211140 RepID=UPI000DF01096|nr:FtsX-like permease family protein [Acidisarcina polymorpha]